MNITVEETPLYIALIAVIAIAILPPALSEEIFSLYSTWGFISFVLFYICPFYLIQNGLVISGIIQIAIHIFIVLFGRERFPVSKITFTILEIVGSILLKTIGFLLDISSFLLRIFLILTFLYFGYSIISWIPQTSQMLWEFKEQILSQVLKVVSFG